MKTVKVVFAKDGATSKPYTFKTNCDIEIGDNLRTLSYDTMLVVVDVEEGAPDESRFPIKELVPIDKLIVVYKKI